METKNKKTFSWARLIPLIILLLGLAAFFYFRVYNYINFASIKTHRELLLQWTEQNHVLATLIFISAYIILTAISAPGAIFLTLISGFLFGPWLGLIYVAIGATIGATLIFLAAKTALHDLFYQKSAAWLKKLAHGFQKNAGSYLLFLRLVPLFPFWLVNIVPAFFGVKTRTFILATFFGILPGTFVYVLLGNGIGVIFSQGKTPDLAIIFQSEIFLPLLGLAILSLIPIIVKSRRSKAKPDKRIKHHA